MKKNEFSPWLLAGTVLLANVLWFATFHLEFSNFWLKITISASLLAALALWMSPPGGIRFHLDLGSVIMGFFSAAALYFIFWAGKGIASLILPFAGNQIAGIYGKGDGTSTLLIFFLLFLVTGPCEELYWRGWLQEGLMLRFGKTRGWLLAVLIYGGVHIWSCNFMLIGAALVAGAFWGAMYRRYRNLAPVIVSHSVWSAFIFAVIPLS